MIESNLDLIYQKFQEIIKKGGNISTDTRSLKKGDVFFALSGENFNGNIFAKKALEDGVVLVVGDDEQKIIDSFGKQFSIDEFKTLKAQNKITIVEDSLKTLQNLASKYRQDLKIPFLGITGSNGKTTTKELTRDVLAQKYNVLATTGNLNNHIGVPLTILSIRPEHNFAIIEMGANHMGEIEILADIAKPDFGIITNIGLAHVGEFGSFENIVKTKKELYDQVFKTSGKIFLNPDDKTLQEMTFFHTNSIDTEKLTQNSKTKTQKFPASSKIFYKKGQIINSEKFLEVEIDKQKISTHLVGEYNLFNLQAAFTIGDFFEVPQRKIVEALENHTPKNNRSQKEITKKGNDVIWDCYNANPSSMQEAMRSFLKSNLKKEKVFILGQMAELGPYSKEEHKKVLEQISETRGKKFLVGKEFLKFQKEFSEKKDFWIFESAEELKDFLEKNPISNSEILVKGSNSTKLFELENNHLF